MSRMFLGLKAGVPVLKIMANNTDDPKTTLNSDWEKFRFNSETTDYSFLSDVILWPRDTTVYYPAGRNSTNYVLKHENNYVFCHVARAIAYYGYMPIILQRIIDPTDNSAVYVRFDSSVDGNFYGMAKIKQQPGVFLTSSFDNGVGAGHPDELVSNQPYVAPTQNMSLITRLPADRDFVPGSGVPVPGQCFASFDEKRGYARVAKGVDAKTASREQCLIHEDQRPITVVATGTVAAAASSTTTIPLGVDVPDGSFPFLLGATTTGKMASFGYPTAGWVFPTFTFGCKVAADDLVLLNGNTQPATVFYTVMVESPDPPTSGGSGKILQTEDDEVIIMRPGASSSPVPADILLHSNYKYLPVIAYGTVVNSAFSATGTGVGGGRELTISVPAVARTPLILTALQKVGATANFNDGDLLIDARYRGASFGTPGLLSYGWVYDDVADTLTFNVTDPSAASAGWVLRYFILGIPD